MDALTTQEVLNEIYLGARAGTYGIDNIKNDVKPDLKELILKQNKLYEEITKDCQKFADTNGFELKDLNMFMKAGSFMQSKMETMFDSSNSNISELMFNGTNMGILNITRIINSGIDNEELLAIAKKFLGHMEDFINSIKDFL